MEKGTLPRKATAPVKATAHEALANLSTVELASRIARGEISSVEAVEAYIERIEQVNPDLNAVIFRRYEEARAEAIQADQRRARGEIIGPLHGVPVTIKESLDLINTPSTFGLASRASLCATQDEIHVRRLRQAGAIILGKTNVAQLLLYLESDNPVYGRTNNPWDTGRSPGGSSGGQAAIIAAGGPPLGLGTDIGGSIRVPAAFCGIVGLKPTTGRTPDAGRYSLPPGQRAIVSQTGVLGREVSDVDLGLEVINGGRNPDTEPPQPLGDVRSIDISRLRVAYYLEDGTFKTSPAVQRAVLEAARILNRCGAQVSAWSPPRASYALDLYYSISCADGAIGLKQTLGRDKRDPRIATLLMIGQRSRPTLAILRTLLRMFGQEGLARLSHNFGHRDTLHYWHLVEAQMEYQNNFRQALDHNEGGPIDILICPPCALPALPHGQSGNLLLAGAYAALYNLLGYPAGVVPITGVQPGEELGRSPARDVMEQAAYKTEVGSAGLPIGVQVVARPWREHVALAVMYALEQQAGLTSAQ